MAATVTFRHDRIDEPLELYSQQFAHFSSIFAQVIDRLPSLRDETLDVDAFAELLRSKDSRRAFCYLTAPPISEDDLKTLAETSLAPGTLKANPDGARRVRDIVFRILDPHRFPWIAKGGDPSSEERTAAIIASAALVAASKVATFRRNDAKDQQEKRVKDLLLAIGFEEIEKRKIPTGSLAPKPGQFMGETPLAGAKADVVATLHDGRILAIECKVSNSSVNSYKRIVHDTGGKATIWYRELGRANVVASAVLNGVFSPANLESVQNDKDVALFWDHRLDDLTDFIKSTSAGNV